MKPQVVLVTRLVQVASLSTFSWIVAAQRTSEDVQVRSFYSEVADERTDTERILSVDQKAHIISRSVILPPA
jgi:hypothetical protein